MEAVVKSTAPFLEKKTGVAYGYCKIKSLCKNKPRFGCYQKKRRWIP